jgi:hypothetical protein
MEGREEKLLPRGIGEGLTEGGESRWRRSSGVAEAMEVWGQMGLGFGHNGRPAYKGEEGGEQGLGAVASRPRWPSQRPAVGRHRPCCPTRERGARGEGGWRG